jgi:hypothetical protein
MNGVSFDPAIYRTPLPQSLTTITWLHKNVYNRRLPPSLMRPKDIF